VNLKLGSLVVIVIAAVAVFTLSAFATDAQMYFSSDKNGQNRVTNVQEGDEIWIVVIDNDENIDCDIRDKMSPDLKIMDPKTGAYIVWDGQPGDATPTDHDYLEETGADTGVFVSARVSLNDFQGGHYLYSDETGDTDTYADDRGYYGASATLTFHPGLSPYGAELFWKMPSKIRSFSGTDLLVGRFENMDSLIGLYQDPNDLTDVALAMMKIIDVEATISWDQDIYKDANTSATITVVDPDENLNCNEVDAVPVFIIVNPGSWNPVRENSPTNFCMLKRTGGINGADGTIGCGGTFCPIRWYDIYNSKANFKGSNPTGAQDGRFYIEYDSSLFSPTTQFTAVSFYAWETGVNTGVFQLNINDILTDLQFKELYVRDVLVAYYLDPNDFDDFKLATAYIEKRQHSITSFTDENRADKELYWIGRDPVYVQVIDAKWLILDETSSNSPVFFTFAGTQLWPVWDALGVGLSDALGGFQLKLDNWKIEAFNEDDIYVRYNDVYYGASTNKGTAQDNSGGLSTVGDGKTSTSFPPLITRTRVRNDVSFDLMSIADTQVYDGSTINMFFLDRQGNRVSGYVNSDCVFVEVIDPDQDEDQYRRERIDAFWDGAQNVPFGPQANREFGCVLGTRVEHTVNPLLGDTNILNDAPAEAPNTVFHGEAKLYVLNPRSGFWAAVDLLETGPATGDFVSVICIDLVDVYECVPSLRVVPGDTIIAVYQDPSNHSDSAWISIKVGIGGGGTPPSQQSTTMFVDADGNEVTNYTDAELVYVKVIDPSHAAATLLANAVEIDGVTYDLSSVEGQADVFMTDGLSPQLIAGEQLTATYVDPTDQTDTSADTITIIASELNVLNFFASPNPFDDEMEFGYEGSGVASVMSVEVYDLAGKSVWSDELTNATEIPWDGTDHAGIMLANGGYIYVITATDGTNTFNAKGTVFVNR